MCILPLLSFRDTVSFASNTRNEMLNKTRLAWFSYSSPTLKCFLVLIQSLSTYLKCLLLATQRLDSPLEAVSSQLAQTHDFLSRKLLKRCNAKSSLFLFGLKPKLTSHMLTKLLEMIVYKSHPLASLESRLEKRYHRRSFLIVGVLIASQQI